MSGQSPLIERIVMPLLYLQVRGILAQVSGVTNVGLAGRGFVDAAGSRYND